MDRRFRLVASLLVMLTLVGCSSTTGKTAGENIDDATITASVKAKLVADAVSNLTKVSVKVNDGVVTLSGTVESPKAKELAVRLARETRGVTDVIDLIDVEGPAATTGKKQ